MKKWGQSNVLSNEEKQHKFSIRYTEGSDFHIVLLYLQQNHVNVSGFLRDLLIATKGHEAFKKCPGIAPEKITHLSQESFQFLVEIIEPMRIDLGEEGKPTTIHRETQIVSLDEARGKVKDKENDWQEKTDLLLNALPD